MAFDNSPLEDVVDERVSDEERVRELLEKQLRGEQYNDSDIAFIEDIQERDPQLVNQVVNEYQQRAYEQQAQQTQQLKNQIDSLRYQGNFTEQAAFSKLRADNEEAQILASGGKKILHITDTESRAEGLEQRLLKMFQDEGVIQQVLQEGKLPDDMVLVHTGDIGPDFFDLQEYRFKAFLPEILADKQGRLEGEDREEFISLYKEMMEEAGVTEELFTLGLKSEQDQQLFQRFQAMLYGMMDPQFKTQEELEEFRKKRAKLHSHLEKAILNHAEHNLEEAKKVFDKYGLNSDNTIIISGNHDVPHLVEEKFGGMYLSEGESRSVGGIKFNRPLGTATGSIYGPHVGRDFMGSNELTEQIPQLRYETDAFQELREFVKDNGFGHFDDQYIDSLIKTSVQKSQMGIISGKLTDFDKRIQEEVQFKIQNRLSRLESTLDHDADVYLGHGDVTHPQFAGLEETRLRQLLASKGKEGKVYLGGHIHNETTNNMNDMYYVNPGAAQNFSNGSVLLDSGNKFLAAKSHAINQAQQNELFYRPKQEIAAQRVNEGGQ